MIRKQKLNLLKSGYSAYAESSELVRLIKRDITKHNLHIIHEETRNGSWFIPISAGHHQKD